MNGKVFSTSNNLYEDQAQILFDYYKKAAEKIVAEETANEDARKALEEELVVLAKKKSTGKILIIVGAVFTLVIIGLIPLIIGIVKNVSAKKRIAAATIEKEELEEAYKNIRREYKVEKLGVAYVPVASQVPYNEKSFVVDHAGIVQNTPFKLSLLHQPEALRETLTDFEEKINTLPIIEGTENSEKVDSSDYSLSMQQVTMHDTVGSVDRQIRNIGYLINDNESVAVELPIIRPNSSELGQLKEYCTTDTGSAPIIPLFDNKTIEMSLESFEKLNTVKQEIEKINSGDTSSYFKKLISRIGNSVDMITRMKVDGSSKIINYYNFILSNVLKASFTQYSPVLEAEEIERIKVASFNYQDSVDDYTPFMLKSSSKVKYDLFSGSWVAEDNSRTSMPFGMHQVQEEVLMPLIQNLMAENRVERLKIYNGIKDQKIDYLNQWHRDTEDFYGRNRTDAQDIISRLQETYGDYLTAFSTYKSLQDTLVSMKTSRSLDSAEVQESDKEAEMIAGYEMQANQCYAKQEEFSNYMERLKDDIDEKAEKFNHVEYYEASLRDSDSRDIARATDGLQELELRRKKLISVSPYIAQYAQLPPEPRVEDSLYADSAINTAEIAKNNLSWIEKLEQDVQSLKEGNEVIPEDVATSEGEQEVITEETQVMEESFENDESEAIIAPVPVDNVDAYEENDVVETEDSDYDEDDVDYDEEDECYDDDEEEEDI